MRRDRKSYMPIYSVIGFLLFLFLFTIQSTSAENIYVDNAGGADYTTIQEAINNANESDTIYVYSGTYNENLIINKSIVLSNTGSGVVKVIGSSDHTTKIMANNIEIKGLTIENDGESFFCIYISQVTGCIIQDNIIKNGGYGIYLVSSNTNTINDNIIQNNNVGVKCTNSDENTIKDNQIMNNNANGIYLDSSSDSNVMFRNYLSDNIQSNARDLGNNFWSSNQQGNYWDDYTNYDNNSDGKGDNPYIIDSDSQDNFPLGVFLTFNQKPIASITLISPNPAESGQTVIFQGQGTDDGTILLWEWTSSIDGDLGSSAEIQSSSSIGTHTISFRVMDDNSEWSDITTDILVINPQSSSDNIIPTATIQTINPTETLEGESIYFHGYGSDSDGYVESYSWRSSIDGIFSSESSFSSSDFSAGSHTIYFKVKDNNAEWSNEATRAITIIKNTTNNNPPVPIINGPFNGIIDSVVIFDATGSYDADSDDIISYLWDFGDDKTGNGEIVTHIYNKSGNFTITLTVEDENNLKESISTYVIIFESPPDEGNNAIEDYTPIEDTSGFEFVLLIFGIILFLFLCKKN